jgi:hypothetical protein
VEVRNRLEHVDEHLDRVALRLADPLETGTSTWLLQNLMVTKRDQIDNMRPEIPASLPLRLYSISDDTYYHLGASIVLARLRLQASSARTLLQRTYTERTVDQGAPDGLNPAKKPGFIRPYRLKSE